MPEETQQSQAVDLEAYGTLRLWRPFQQQATTRVVRVVNSRWPHKKDVGYVQSQISAFFATQEQMTSMTEFILFCVLFLFKTCTVPKFLLGSVSTIHDADVPVAASVNGHHNLKELSGLSGKGAAVHALIISTAVLYPVPYWGVETRVYNLERFRRPM